MKHLFINFVFFFYSLISIAMKLGSNQKFFSLNFLIFYFIVILMLFIYAIMWQKILKYFNLGTAYIYKGTTIIWTLLWSVIFFSEKISFNNMIGGLIVLFGIFMIQRKEN